MIVTWAGWSTLHLDAGLRVLIDPCVSGLLGAPCAWSRAPVDAIVLTHGHHEHLRDLHRVLRDIDAPVWAPEPVIRWVTARRGVDRRRCTALEDGVEVSLPAGRLTPRAFPHLPKNVVAGKLAALWRRRRTTPWLAMLRAAPQVFEAHLVTRSQPEEGPYFALDLALPAGRVIWSSEALTHLLAPAVWAGWCAGRPPRAALLGVESGEEASVKAAAALVAVGSVRAVPLHAPFERFYGRPAVDWAALGLPRLQRGAPWAGPAAAAPR